MKKSIPVGSALPHASPAAASALRRRYGDWAVVTGASDGIGRAFARELAREGLNLVLVARRGIELKKLADGLRLSSGVDCRVIVADLADMKAVEAMVAATADLDVGMLVATAGFGTSGPLIDASLEDETGMVDLNCTGVLVA